MRLQADAARLPAPPMPTPETCRRDPDPVRHRARPYGSETECGGKGEARPVIVIVLHVHLPRPAPAPLCAAPPLTPSSSRTRTGPRFHTPTTASIPNSPPPQPRRRHDRHVRHTQAHTVLHERSDDDFDAAVGNDVGGVDEGDDGRDDGGGEDDKEPAAERGGFYRGEEAEGERYEEEVGEDVGWGGTQ